MIGTPEYSARERMLFRHFGLESVVRHTQPITAYTMAAHVAFMRNDQSRWANALRRCITAMEEIAERDRIWRLTPEWDDLIIGKPLRAEKAKPAPKPLAPGSPPNCEECDTEMDRYEDAADTGAGGWACSDCGWSMDDSE